MSRFIDTVPLPEKVVDKRVIVLSISRSGTLGLYHALNMLGYKTYHMAEVLVHGVPHMKIFQEGLIAHEGKGRPFTKTEFDKWTPEYDCMCIVPGYMTEEIVAAYPNAKFILTERDPDAWVRSINGSVAGLARAASSFPLALFKHFDQYNFEFFRLVLMIFDALSARKGPTDEGLVEARQFYLEHSEKVKKLVRPENLLVVKLEEGLDFQAICPFLEKDIPSEPYPRGNDPQEFKKMVQSHIKPGIKKGMLATAGLVLPTVGAAVWFLGRNIWRR